MNVVDGIPFRSYQFTTWSAAATGGYARLTDTDNDVNTPTHPEIKVGNIPSASAGTATVTPTMYVGDEGDVKITFKAAGPIYDINATVDDPDTLAGTGDVDAQIVIALADSTDDLTILQDPLPRTEDHDTDPATPNVRLVPPPAVTAAQVTRLDVYDSPGAPQTSNRGNSGFLSITSRSKVVLGNPALVVDGTTATINIVKMDKDGVVELTYKKMWAAQASTDLATVTVTSDGTSSATEDLGEILARPGTGTVEIADMAVQINTPRDFTITYKAATRIEDAYFAVEIPASVFMMPDVSDDTQLIALTLTDANHPDPTTVDPHPNGATPGSRYQTKVGLRWLRVKATLDKLFMRLVMLLVLIITSLFGVR